MIALLAKDDVIASTHNGVRTEFFKRYIKTEILDRNYSSFYTELMSKRQESDYADFQKLTDKEILPLLKEAKEFIKGIRDLISK